MLQLPNLEILNTTLILDSSIPSGLRFKSGRAAGDNFVENPFSQKHSRVKIKGKLYYSHRIVYAIYNQNTEIDNKVIDHIDGNKRNNCGTNLRAATAVQNSQHQTRETKSKCGVKGVRKKGSKWQAYIKHEKRMINLGHFNELESAAKAYNEAAVKFRGEFCGKLN